MFLRPARSRAVPRRPTLSSNSVWISEELLHDIYQRFYVTSRVCKRNGSFVPGPMECRRRLGRRRMAYALDHPTSSPGQGISALWNWLFRDIDTSQWKWEAPKLPAPNSLTCEIPQADYALDAHAPATTIWSDLVESSKTSQSDVWSFPGEIDKLCGIIKIGTEEEIWENCCQFNKSLKQNIVLGLMPESNIRIAIRKLTRSLKSSTLPQEFSDQMCLIHFEAIWEGVTSCRVFPLEELSGKLLKDILWEFHRLSPSAAWQTLVGKIIRSATADQLQSMRASLCLVISRWRESWTEEAIPTSYQVSQLSFLMACDAESHSASRVLHVSQLCKNAIKNSTQHDVLVAAYQALREAYFSINAALKAITNFENTIIIQRGSVLALSDILRSLPRPLLHHVLWSCTTKLCNQILPYGDHWKKHYWLSLIAQLPGVDNKLFVQLWGEMDAEAEPLEPYLCVEPVLSQWASQGHSPNHLLIRNTLEIMHCGHLDFGTLLYAVHKHKELIWSKTSSLFSLLDALNRYKIVLRILGRMRQLGMKVPKNIFRSSIETMVRYDIRKAFQLCLLGRIPLWTCPKLLSSVVRNPLIPSNEIWRLLRLPNHRLQPQVVAKSPIWWDLKSLLVKMIIEFAYSEGRSQKVVFRNVYRYIRYLQLHKMPITPDVSRALTYAGLTRRMILGKFVRGQTLHYILGVIRRVEGTAVAEEVEQAVLEWNEQILRQQHWGRRQQQIARREMNVLRVGPID